MHIKSYCCEYFCFYGFFVTILKLFTMWKTQSTSLRYLAQSPKAEAYDAFFSLTQTTKASKSFSVNMKPYFLTLSGGRENTFCFRTIVSLRRSSGWSFFGLHFCKHMTCKPRLNPWRVYTTNKTWWLQKVLSA